MASVRFGRLAPVLQRVLVRRLGRFGRVGQLRAVGLGAVPLRSLVLPPVSRMGLAAGLRLLASLGVLGLGPVVGRLGARRLV